LGQGGTARDDHAGHLEVVGVGEVAEGVVVGHEDALTRRDRGEDVADLGVRLRERRRDLLAAGGVGVVAGHVRQLGADEGRARRHALHIEPDVGVLGAVVVLCGVVRGLLLVLVPVLAERQRVEQGCELEHAGAVVRGRCQRGLEALLEAEAVRDHQVRPDHLGDVGRRRREVVRVGAHRHERADLTAAARHHLPGDVAEDRGGGDHRDGVRRTTRRAVAARSAAARTETESQRSRARHPRQDPAPRYRAHRRTPTHRHLMRIILHTGWLAAHCDGEGRWLGYRTRLNGE